MFAFVPFFVSAALAALSESGFRFPTNVDLETALRGTSGMRYGSDEEPSVFRPHEMLLRMDVRTVPDDLLLGVLLAGATFGDPVDVARRLMTEVSFDVTRLQEASPWERTPGVGTVGRARVVAATELARRVDVRSSFAKRMTVTRPAEAVAALSQMSLGPEESLSALFLDRRRRVIAGRTLTVGNDQFTIVDPRQIFKTSIEVGASGVILAHNHPSGDPTPSSQDVDVTERVARAGRTLGIPLLDHLVLGSEGRWTSLAEQGLLSPWTSSPPTWTSEGAMEPEEVTYRVDP